MQQIFVLVVVLHSKQQLHENTSTIILYSELQLKHSLRLYTLHSTKCQKNACELNSVCYYKDKIFDN